MHKCDYDQISVEEDNLFWKDSRLGWVSQKVNYCSICGWTKIFAEIMTQQNTNDGI